MSNDKRRVQTVSQLTVELKQQLESNFASVWVCGEVSNLSRPNSGHYYFTLKDENSQIRTVVWRSTAERMRFEIEEGQQIICCGDIDLYLPRGSYQLIARKVEPVGAGDLQLAFKKLHRKLGDEGLFDPQHKLSLPTLPERIGVVTSPTGAAVRDFCQVVKRRWPRLKILIIPCRVQGDEAPHDIVRAIQVAGRLRPKLDALVVTRGGGSVEDLWCFNNEDVVRAIYACPIPSISAIGHEIDVTLSDLVADVRALTPSEAGEKIVPDRREWMSALDESQLRLTTLLRHQTKFANNRLEAIASQRCFRRPTDLVAQLHQRIDSFDSQIGSAIERVVERKHNEVANFSARLNSINPLEVLARGYSLTVDSHNKSIVSPTQVCNGDEIRTRFEWGEVNSQVNLVKTKSSDQSTSTDGE